MGGVLTICLALAAVLSYRQFPTPCLVIALLQEEHADELDCTHPGLLT